MKQSWPSFMSIDGPRRREAAAFGHSTPLVGALCDANGCQQAPAERIAVIPRAPFRGRPGEDRDIAY
jgi:hypothetical protein